MKSLELLDYIVFGLYFVLVVGVALYVSRKPKDHDRDAEDYFLAGRSLPWYIIGASLIASNISTEQIIGMNGTAFESGIAVISYSLIGGAISILIVGKYFLPRFLKGKIYSMPEFLEKRFGKRVSTLMGVFWILVYIFVNLTSVLSLGAITLNAVLGIPIIYSVIGLALFSAIYTIYGGLSAVAWTDIIQVGVLVVGGLAVVWLGLDEVALKHSGEGVIEGLSKLMEVQSEKFHTILPTSHEELPWTGVFMGGLWIAALSYWGCNQYIIQRALAAKSLKEAQHGLLFAAVLSIIVAVIIVVPGVIASELFPDSIGARDEAFPVLIRELLPVGYSGLVIAALIAAIISSLNSMCNSVATIFTMDIYRNSINPKASNYQLVFVGRIVTAVALVIAVIVTPAVASMGRLFAFIQEYTGFVTPGVLCIFLLGLFWKRTTGKAALWAVLLTIPISVLFKVLLPEIAFLDRMTLVFLLLVVTTVLISLKDKPEQREIQKLEAADNATAFYNIGALVLVALTAVFYLVFK
ncbi:sodium:solute symporter family transporter [Maribacter sp. 2210JD10-5]|uniref:sodium:solute symporter family transporter n=1 Tax=Maribacter sp. 2210JD10-5 TaxID=3386272 RepID=UPI0039BD7172